jgi:hypothetical protein
MANSGSVNERYGRADGSSTGAVPVSETPALSQDPPYNTIDWQRVEGVTVVLS